MELDLRTARLDNGLRIATVHVPRVASMAMGIQVGVGGRHEARRQAGVSHFIEHLLFKGTQRRSAREISAAIEGRGGYCNAYTQEEATCYYAHTAARHAGPVFAILADMYLNPRFAPADIERERGVIIEEIMMYRDQPEDVAHEQMQALLWPDHALGRPLTGTPESVRALSRDDLLAFKQRSYRPGDTVVVWAGAVDHDAAVNEVAKHFSAARGGHKPANRRFARVAEGPFVCVRKKAIEQTHLALGLRIPGRDDPRRFAAALLGIILGGNMSSRLFQVIRERHGLAYSVHSSVHRHADTGVFMIHAGLDRRRSPRALQLIVREMQRLTRKPVGAQTLRRAKDYAIGQLALSMENTVAHMRWMLGCYLPPARFLQPAEVMRRIEAVKPQELLSVAADTFRARHAAVGLVGPQDERLSGETVGELLGRL